MLEQKAEFYGQETWDPATDPGGVRRDIGAMLRQAADDLPPGTLGAILVTVSDEGDPQAFDTQQRAVVADDAWRPIAAALQGAFASALVACETQGSGGPVLQRQ